MKAAIFNADDARPGRIAFTMSRYDLLRLAFNSIKAAILGVPSIAISVGDLEILKPPKD